LKNIKFQNLNYKKGQNGYYNYENILSDAKSHSMDICDFIEFKSNTQGSHSKIIDRINNLINFKVDNINALEIGTGTGCFAEKTLNTFNIKSYESYETDLSWSKYLERKFKILSRQCNGYNLSETPDKSISLLFSHFVFVYISIRVTLSYFYEILRVSAKDAVIVFDYFSFDDLEGEEQQKSFSNNPNTWHVYMDDSFVKEFFLKRNFSLLGEFYREETIGR
jgi:phospholipid N-methyltransferase